MAAEIARLLNASGRDRENLDQFMEDFFTDKGDDLDSTTDNEHGTEQDNTSDREDDMEMDTDVEMLQHDEQQQRILSLGLHTDSDADGDEGEEDEEHIKASQFRYLLHNFPC